MLKSFCLLRDKTMNDFFLSSFSTKPFHWFVLSKSFMSSAQVLEDNVKKAGKKFENEFSTYCKKRNISENNFVERKPTKKEQKFIEIIRCKHVYPYLYCHALELLLKGIAYGLLPEDEISSLKNKHGLKSCLEKIKIYVIPFPFNIEEINKMLDCFDNIGTLFRYPFPVLKKNETLKDRVKHMKTNIQGLEYPTSDLSTLFEDNRIAFFALIDFLLKHNNIKKILPKS